MESPIIELAKILNDETKETSVSDNAVVLIDDHYQHYKTDKSGMPDLCSAYYEDDSINNIESALENVTKNDYAPFIVILQSSGYGKTRSLLELANKRKLVYLLCQDIPGGFKTPDIIQAFLKRCDQCNSQQGVERVCSKLFEAIDIVTSQYKTAVLLKQAQISKEGKFGEFYDNIFKVWQKLHTPLTSPVKTDKMSDNSQDPLVIVFDEANILFSRNGDVLESPYRCLRRVLSACKNKLGVFADTSSELARFLPPGAPSDRQCGLGKFLSPVMDICTVDVIPVTSDMSYFVSLFTRGRPLWAMQLRYREDNDLTRLIHFAYYKLSGVAIGKIIPEISGKIALFGCRFGLGETTKLASKLVSQNLATIVGIDYDRTQVYSKYLSEPILAEASAYCTSKHPFILLDTLDAVCSSLDSQIISPAKGDRGEMAAAAALAFVADSLRFKCVLNNYNASETNMSKNIPAKDFLKAVCPHLTSCEPLENFCVNFTHFYRLPITPDGNILPHLWNRHVAAYLPAGEEGIDMLIVMKSDKMFSTIRIQIKNLKEKISEQCCKNFLLKLAPMRCAPKIPENFSVALLLAVGAGKIEPSCKHSPCFKSKRSLDGQQATQLWLASSLIYLDIDKSVKERLAALAGKPLSSRIMVGLKLREGNFAALFENM
nr:uncharacterized protein LOC105848676 isoform X2 [Hydra vulgaris]